MHVFIVILSIISIIGLIIFIILSINSSLKKDRIKDWKVDDSIQLIGKIHKMIKFKNGLATLKAWDLNNVYLKTKSNELGTVIKISMDNVDYNKSQMWRDNYINAEKTMGKEPGFGAGIKKSIEKEVVEKPLDNFTFVFNGKTLLIRDMGVDETEFHLNRAIHLEEDNLSKKLKEHLKTLKE